MAYTDIDKPSDYFETVIYAGGTTDISSLDFQPDWVWGKKRTGAENHALFDSVRGATKTINSNTSATESTRSGSLTSFDSDGFTMGGSDGIISSSGNNYVAWSWKAGTSASGNTSGSGTAKTFSSSSNSTSGFSIVKYVGNGTTNHAIPHGCGTPPTMIIVKTTTKSNQAWPVDCRQDNNGAGGVMYLNETGGAGGYGNDNPFTSVAPTSSVFSVGSPGNTNFNNDTYIAYCFAEKKGYSKFGSYTGNGDSDGAFVYTGFKPAFVMFKRSSGTGNWQLLDNKRLGYNVENITIYPNSNIAEQDENDADLLSNGFKLRGSGTDGNGSGSKYIYMAFAENPFVTSTGVPATAR